MSCVSAISHVISLVSMILLETERFLLLTVVIMLCSRHVLSVSLLWIIANIFWFWVLFYINCKHGRVVGYMGHNS